jgi:hypothetical protein
MLRTLSQPISNGVPVERVCEKLKAKDGSICDLQYEQKIDLKTVRQPRLCLVCCLQLCVRLFLFIGLWPPCRLITRTEGKKSYRLIE